MKILKKNENKWNIMKISDANKNNERPNMEKGKNDKTKKRTWKQWIKI